MLKKIEALLRKAQSTAFEEEAALLYAKAQELMEKYAISEEALWQDDPSQAAQPILETIQIRGDAAYDRFLMLSTIAKVNRCKVWKHDTRSKTHVYFTKIAGFPSDITFVTALYTSLLLQLNLACVIAETEEPFIESLRTWRISFTEAYCERVSQRLLAQKAEREKKTPSTGSKELVLAREVKVQKYVEDELAIKLRSFSYNRNSFDPSAYAKGSEAAENADIGNPRLPGRKKELR